MLKVREVLKEHGKLSEQDLVEHVEGDEDSIMNTVSELKRQGEIFEPQAGKVQKI